MDPWRNSWAVLTREYLVRVRSRAFVISTVLVPLIMGGLVVVPLAMEGRGSQEGSGLLVMDRTGVMTPLLLPRLAEAGFTVEVVDEGELGTPQALVRRMELGPYLALLELDHQTLNEGRALWRGEAPPPPLRRLAIQQAVVRTAVELRLEVEGDPASVGRLLDGGKLEFRLLGSTAPAPPSEGRMALAIAGAFFLYMVILIYGTMLLRAVLEEKTGRIAEVLLSAMRPWELMLGKVLGVGAVGLSQLAIWLGMAALIILAVLPGLPDEMLAGYLAALPPGLIPGPGLLGFFLVSFLLGYFLYASLFAAVGAMCSTEEEAQQAQFPVVMLVVVPVILLFPLMENPDSTASVILSLVPFFAPILMFGRVALDAAPVWQAALAVGIMGVTLLGTAWAAGRIYRVGILMQGKRPTVPELWKWLRRP
ncbi:MAG: ABC transporter permease [Gemmatimonadota bacterium]